jgi:hypothetical protein
MHYSVSARPKCLGPLEGCPQETSQLESLAEAIREA